MNVVGTFDTLEEKREISDIYKIVTIGYKFSSLPKNVNDRHE